MGTRRRGGHVHLQGNDGLSIHKLASICADLVAFHALQRCLDGGKGILPSCSLQALQSYGQCISHRVEYMLTLFYHSKVLMMPMTCHACDHVQDDADEDDAHDMPCL